MFGCCAPFVGIFKTDAKNMDHPHIDDPSNQDIRYWRGRFRTQEENFEVIKVLIEPPRKK